MKGFERVPGKLGEAGPLPKVPSGTETEVAVLPKLLDAYISLVVTYLLEAISCSSCVSHEVLRMKWYAVIVTTCLHLAIASEAVPIANVASDQVASLMSPTPYMYKVPLSPENEVPR